MKKLLIILLALTLVMSLASCKKCKEHRDADDDYLCDSCGENFDDGDENPEPPVDQGHKVTFTVKLDNGTAVSGVKFTIHRGETVFATLVSGADGTVEATLDNQAYSIEFDYESLPSGCIPDTFAVKVEEGKDNIELLIIDNTPDGSAAKPFPIVENETPVTIGAGETVYFRYRGSSVRYLTVDSEAITVNFAGESYSLTAGNLPLVITPDIGTETGISLSNGSDAEVSFTLSMTAPLGSNENPITLEGNGATVTVNCESIVFYSWIATSSGTLTLTSDSARNNISITKIVENDVPVTEQTGGESSVSFEVNEGDVITIGVSALEGEKNEPFDVEISFTLTVSE